MKVADIKVELLNFMGDDLDVANIARVSFDKQSELVDGELQEKDAKLIRYLADHNHWSPFAHCQAQFRIKAPIFVARQLQKHVIGLVWNEVSRRYVDAEPEFYLPSSIRTRPENMKQGSVDGGMSLQHQAWCIHGIEHLTKRALETYQELLIEGVCPEQARMVLPQNMMTEWIWTGSLMAFARVFKLRFDPHAQAETRKVAEGIYIPLTAQFPHSWQALTQTK